MKLNSSILLEPDLNGLLGGIINGGTSEGVTTAKADENAKPTVTTEEPSNEPTNSGETISDVNDQFNARLNGTPIPEKKEEQKKEEEKSSSDVPELKLEKEETPKDKEEPVKEQPKKAPVKDYAGLNDEEKTLFSRMSNEAYEKLKPIYTEYKALKAKEGEFAKIQTEFENYKKATSEPTHLDETGYVHLPKYQEAFQRAEMITDDIAFYEAQLLAIEEGQKFYIKGADGKVNPTPQDPSPKARMQIQNHLQRLLVAQNNENATMQQIAGGYQERIKGVKGYYKGLEDQYYPMYKDKKDPMVDNMLTVLAEHGQQFNPLAGLFAKTVAFLGEHQKTIVSLRQEVERLKSNKKDETVAGLPSSRIQTGVSTQPKEELNYDDFTKRLRR